MLPERLATVKRFVQSWIFLTTFLLLPTMWLKKNYVLAVARLPVWKKFDFFVAMFKIINEDAEGRRKSE